MGFNCSSLQTTNIATNEDDISKEMDAIDSNKAPGSQKPSIYKPKEWKHLIRVFSHRKKIKQTKWKTTQHRS